VRSCPPPHLLIGTFREDEAWIPESGCGRHFALAETRPSTRLHAERMSEAVGCSYITQPL
jgi:hypothetical protein